MMRFEEEIAAAETNLIDASAELLSYLELKREDGRADDQHRRGLIAKLRAAVEEYARIVERFNA